MAGRGLLRGKGDGGLTAAMEGGERRESNLREPVGRDGDHRGVLGGERRPGDLRVAGGGEGV